MPLKTMFSSELLDEYKNGRRVFSNILLQYIDISGIDLSGIEIKDSKLFFATFRDCNMRNTKFLNCEIIYGSFYGGDFSGSIFDNCVLDMTLFQKIYTRGMKMLKSRLIWSAILESASEEIDISSSTQLKFFTNLSQLTEKDLKDAMNHISPLIDSLDISIRHKVKQEMEKDAQSLGLNIPKESHHAGYSKKPSNYSSSSLAYGMQDFSNMVINAYNEVNSEKQKSVYETKRKYGNQ